MRRYPIIVAACEPDCPPTRALLSEGYEIREAIMPRDDPYRYGRLLLEQWCTGHGFVLIEHDVVPWPGAVGQLMDCGEDWCSFPYLIGVNNSLTGIGCVRFSDALLARHAPDGPAWCNTAWHGVDGQVNGMLEAAGETCHVHSPPVAHLKASPRILRHA